MAVTPILIADAQPPAVRGSADVLELMAREVREATDVTVRDALIGLLLGVLIEYQYRSDLAEAENDVLRSTGEHLRDDGEERGFSQGDSESQADFRARVLSTLDVVSKDAIVAAVNAILAPYTSTECILLEPALDGWFVHDGTDGDGGDASWHAFVGATPNYPDRLFEGDELQNGGYFRPNSDPLGIRAFNLSPRQFLLLVPDMTGFGDDAAWLWESTEPPEETLAEGWFVDDGSDPLSGFIAAGAGSEEAIYGLIVRTVNLLAGQSVSWDMNATLEAA